MLQVQRTLSSFTLHTLAVGQDVLLQTAAAVHTVSFSEYPVEEIVTAAYNREEAVTAATSSATSSATFDQLSFREVACKTC